MSNRPGLGSTWFQKYGGSDVIAHDFVVADGSKVKVPRYYDVLLGRQSPLYLAETKAKRLDKAQKAYSKLEDLAVNKFDDLQRLDVHERVRLAQIKMLKRS